VPLHQSVDTKVIFFSVSTMFYNSFFEDIGGKLCMCIQRISLSLNKVLLDRLDMQFWGKIQYPKAELVSPSDRWIKVLYCNKG
jgi:hypothetical protein